LSDVILSIANACIWVYYLHTVAYSVASISIVNSFAKIYRFAMLPLNHCKAVLRKHPVRSTFATSVTERVNIISN
jgi:hypothetical protein